KSGVLYRLHSGGPVEFLSSLASSRRLRYPPRFAICAQSFLAKNPGSHLASSKRRKRASWLYELRWFLECPALLRLRRLACGPFLLALCFLFASNFCLVAEPKNVTLAAGLSVAVQRSNRPALEWPSRFVLQVQSDLQSWSSRRWKLGQ